MAQTGKECVEFLENARNAVEALAVVEDREKQLIQDEGKKKKLLEMERKQVAELVAQTIKKRRDEIDSSYDTEIGKAQEQLKKARARREKAKNQGVKERIAEETFELHSHNKELRLRMKTVFRQNHVPGFCKSRLYYSLFFPRWIKEFLTLLLFVAVLFVALPCGIYLLIPNHRTIYLAGIYALDILIFGGMYVGLSNHTKMRYMEPLKEGRQILDEIHANNRKIRVITSTIRKDRNESFYDLEKYDDEIARIQQELSSVALKKKDTLNTFENVTKTILQDEIEHNHEADLVRLQNEYEEVRSQLKETSTEVKERRLDLADHYSTYLGREFLDPLKIQDLKGMIERGEASNISEAIEVYRTKAKQKAELATNK